MDDPTEPRPRRLVAGSSAGERTPVDRGSARSERWFEPLHVQDPAAARERIGAQIAVGADIVIAPTWRTHRRALMDVGESRRAREWTEAAVRVAREGVDAGLERRDDAARSPTPDDSADDVPDSAEDEGPSIAIVRERPLVAGALPTLDDEPEPGSGRLLPREPAAARDYEEAAGHLADAGVDLVLVETRLGDRGLRTAVEAGARTGLPTWVAAIGPLPERAGIEGALAAWAETSSDAGAVALLLPDGAPEVAARVAEGIAAPSWGGLVGEVGERAPERLAADADTWLDVGAEAVGLLRGARPDRLSAIRSTIDRYTRRQVAERRTREERWGALVERGASMAPGGAALWLGSPSKGAATFPAGFDWTIARHEEAHHLPRERYRFIVVPAGAGIPPSEVAGLLDAAGILVAALEADSGPAASLEDVRLVDVDTRSVPALAIYRREA